MIKAARTIFRSHAPVKRRTPEADFSGKNNFELLLSLFSGERRQSDAAANQDYYEGLRGYFIDDNNIKKKLAHNPDNLRAALQHVSKTDLLGAFLIAHGAERDRRLFDPSRTRDAVAFSKNTTTLRIIQREAVEAILAKPDTLVHPHDIDLFYDTCYESAVGAFSHYPKSDDCEFYIGAMEAMAAQGKLPSYCATTPVEDPLLEHPKFDPVKFSIVSIISRFPEPEMA